ncbi:hypothetical protein [Maribacter polysaccharolyticus]|uniref:hypothetical protein n=1 Tax=Maribacter polysaccharolyticus TaxID=3020831 RepID=UPI00237F9AE3|nr:hypothetical protein [Maribacter polysaccharolyticus]MDE3743478.1 hypothetical protein [Maribacter polysaccharolyticus]
MITGDLEYMISSLPYLTFQDTDEERSKVFSILEKYASSSESGKNLSPLLDAEAKKFLAPKAYRIFEQIDLETIYSASFQKSKNQELAAFSTYMYSLKKDIRQLRISRKNGVESASKKASMPLIPGNPLEEELQLLRWQWDKLEALSIGHYADFGALVIYKLKLLLLLRWWGFDQEKGFEKFLNSTKMTEDGR